jgi:hypothetical protein
MPRCGAKRRSNSSTDNSPRSSRRSSASAAGFSRNVRFTVSGGRPSATENALKESKTFVVRTPPKSVSSPLTSRAAAPAL